MQKGADSAFLSVLSDATWAVQKVQLTVLHVSEEAHVSGWELAKNKEKKMIEICDFFMRVKNVWLSIIIAEMSDGNL